jgi:methionine-rich copper-binding protein CopC
VVVNAMLRPIIGLLALPLMAAPAFAHAFLDSAAPPVGSQVATAPHQVAITFTEAVEPHFSTIQVLDPQGGRVDTGNLHTKDDGKVLTVGVKPLPPGRYAVVWHVTSVDTHKTEGRFTFTVGP